jgi:hypothetical protein
MPCIAPGTGRPMRIARRACAYLLPATLACVMMCAPGAQALSSFGLVVSLRPVSGLPASYFKLRARAGQKVNAGQIVLANRTASAMRVTLDPVDAQTTSTLGSAYLLPGARRHRSTRWIRLSRRSVTLGPGRQAAVTIAVAVSRSKPGDYLSGISIEVPQRRLESTPARRISIVSTERYAIGLEVSLPGPRHPLIRFTGARAEREPAGLSFLLLARNPGNVILQGVHGWARVTRGPRLVARATIGPGTFVTNTAIAFPVRALRETPSQGTVYHVTAVMRYRGGVAWLRENVTFGHRAALAQQRYGGPAPPHSAPWWRWPLIAAVALAVCAAALLLLARRRRPRTTSATLKLLERTLLAARARGEPVSITLLAPTSGAVTSREIAAAIRPRLRRADRACHLGHDGLLIVSGGMGWRAADALYADLDEFLAGRPRMGHRAITITNATAERPIGATELLDQVNPRPAAMPA